MKKLLWIFIIILVIIIEAGMIVYSYVKDYSSDIPDEYILLFKGESAETVYSTYIYKTKIGKKIQYKYINTVSTSNGYDSTNWEEKIIKKGKFNKKSKVYEIAEKNNAYSYAKFYNDDKIYSIEEMKERFK